MPLSIRVWSREIGRADRVGNVERLFLIVRHEDGDDAIFSCSERNHLRSKLRTLASSSFSDCSLELSAETAFTPVSECAPKRLAERLLLASHCFCRYENRSGPHRKICADAKEILNDIPAGVRFSKTEAQTAIVRVTRSFAATVCTTMFACCGVGRKQSQPSIEPLPRRLR